MTSSMHIRIHLLLPHTHSPSLPIHHTCIVCLKSVMFSCVRRQKVTPALRQLSHDLDVFITRGLKDLSDSTKGLEKARTEHRAALLWFKKESAKLSNPDNSEQLANFRMVSGCERSLVILYTVCFYADTYICTHAHTHMCARTHTHEHMHTHILIHARTQTHAHTHACTYTHTHTHTQHYDSFI